MKTKSGLIGLAVVAGALWPTGLAATVACAAEGDHAALVVDTGQDVFRMCVTLDAPEIDGLHLIELASDQYGMAYQFGYGGKAVCQLGNVPEPNPPEECFEDGREFWAHWRSDGSSGWVSASGAGSTRVEDGDTFGWSFGDGESAGTHQEPPPADFETVCADHLATEKVDEGPADDQPGPDPDNEPPDPESTSGPGEGDGARARPQRDASSEARQAPRQSSDERRLDSAPVPSEFDGRLAEPAAVGNQSSPEPSLPAGATSAGAEPKDFPAAGVLAIVATIAMAGVAAYLLTRRKST